MCEHTVRARPPLAERLPPPCPPLSLTLGGGQVNPSHAGKAIYLLHYVFFLIPFSNLNILRVYIYFSRIYARVYTRGGRKFFANFLDNLPKNVPKCCIRA